MDLKKLISILGTQKGDVAKITELTVQETKENFDDISSSPVINYCHWLLTRIAWFSRKENFDELLKSIGVDVPEDFLASDNGKK
ncbi:hypothetical protein ACFL1Z_01250 [Thermodesulfobacteriota bacterium]